MSDKPIKFKDFDEAVEELDLPDIVFVIKGISYSLPAQISAKAVLKQMEFFAEDTMIEPNQIPQWLEVLIGEQNLKGIVDSGATWEQINELATWLLQQYGIAPEMDLDETLEKVIADKESGDNPK